MKAASGLPSSSAGHAPSKPARSSTGSRARSTCCQRWPSSPASPYATSHPLDGLSLKPLLEPGTGAAGGWPDRHLVNHWRGSTSVRSQQYRPRPRRPPVRNGRRSGPAERCRRGAAPRRPPRLASVRAAWIADRTARASGRGRPAVSDRPSRTRVHASPGSRRHCLTARSSGRAATRTTPIFTNWTSPDDAIGLGRRGARRRPLRGRRLHHPAPRAMPAR